jgi:hypothetical protein
MSCSRFPRVKTCEPENGLMSRDDPTTNLDPRYFPTGAVVERPIAQRPKHDTVDGIIEWLSGPAQHIPSLGDEFDEFAWRMLAAGFPLLRATLQLRTLHPQYPGGQLRLVADYWSDRADFRYP